MERRYTSSAIELRESQGDEPALMRGTVVKWNTLSHTISPGFKERVMQGAFTKTLNDGNDKALLHQHDASNGVLARTKNGSLKLFQDDTGLRFEARIAPTPAGLNVLAQVRAGLLDEMSWGFMLGKGDDEWSDMEDDVDGGMCAVRTIRNVTSLFEVSCVNGPAYPGTSVGARSHFPDGVPAELREKFLKNIPTRNLAQYRRMQAKAVLLDCILGSNLGGLVEERNPVDKAIDRLLVEAHTKRLEHE
jgi:uncharacterized protein